jgi:hypothetical protein
MSTLLLSLLLIVLITIGLMMSNPIREYFTTETETADMTDAEWATYSEQNQNNIIKDCLLHDEARWPSGSDFIRKCKYVAKNLPMERRFKGVSNKVLDNMQPWCNYLKANYPSASTGSVSTLSEVLKKDSAKQAKDDELQITLERKCNRMAIGMDETLTPQNKDYWHNVCRTLDKITGKKAHQLDVIAQQPYYDEQEEDEVLMPVKRYRRKRWVDPYQQNVNDTERDSCPDMSHYVKMDEIPCWNCSLP